MSGNIFVSENRKKSAKFFFLDEICLLSANFYFVVSIHTAKNFQFMYSQERFSKASLIISNKCFQNPICDVLSGIMEFYGEVQYYSRCSHSAVSIGSNIFPNGITKLQLYRRFIISDWKYIDGTLNWLFPPFLKYIL
jgi:hypothetical protein